MRFALYGAILVAFCLGTHRAEAEIAGGKIKIGVLNDQSGLYADLSGQGSVDAARMAVEDAGGSVAGAAIEIVSADHQNKPDIGTTFAQQWYDQDKVDIIVDVPNSGVALAVQEVARERNKIVIFSGPGSTKLIGEKCSPTGFLWTYDSYALAKGTGAAVTRSGGTSWYFLTADYAFGQALENDTTSVVLANGGTVIGSVKAPVNSADFSSYLLQAQASNAKVIGLANAGADAISSIKQASEFGIIAGGQKLVGLLVFLTDVNSVGLKTAQGLDLTESFYWDLNDATRTWSKRFFDRNKRMPTMVQAGVYSGVAHYLKAVKALGSKDTALVTAEMRRQPVNDFMTDNAVIRADGKLMRAMYLFQVKKPEESHAAWDYYKLIRTIPPEETVRPLSESTCPLVKKS